MPQRFVSGAHGKVCGGPCHLVWQARMILLVRWDATRFDKTPVRLVRQVNKILTLATLRTGQATIFIEGGTI